ncbi:protein MIZU-KUSSEI 1-like [Curcuma longa]|uniref:protein MIZU-KUSSEI 1-like n=1 Tax=Curcuma longa TaxID=136217 RepID=UPI003D9F832F
MPSMVESPGGMVSLLRQAFEDRQNRQSGKASAAGRGGGGMFKMFKLLPMLSSGCKMVKLLAVRPSRQAMLADKANAVTLFGARRGRINLAIQEDPRSPPFFLIELPLSTWVLHREIESGSVKLALESETRTPRRKVAEEYVWAVYCNGRKAGYSIRRKEASDEDRRVMGLLRGVSMGAGVLPGFFSEKDAAADGDLTYMRARFERLVGSKDSESFYMINPDDGASAGGELSIFLVRLK